MQCNKHNIDVLLQLSDNLFPYFQALMHDNLNYTTYIRVLLCKAHSYQQDITYKLYCHDQMHTFQLHNQDSLLIYLLHPMPDHYYMMNILLFQHQLNICLQHNLCML